MNSSASCGRVAVIRQELLPDVRVTLIEPGVVDATEGGPSSERFTPGSSGVPK